METEISGNCSTTMDFDPPKKHILWMTDKDTKRLIDLYKYEECLWNPKSPDYRNKVVREIAADKIAKEMNIPDFKARHVIMKFKNLRNSYHQECKRMKLLPNYTPKVVWFKNMASFIKAYTGPKNLEECSDMYTAFRLESLSTNEQLKSETDPYSIIETTETSIQYPVAARQKSRKGKNTKSQLKDTAGATTSPMNYQELKSHLKTMSSSLNNMDMTLKMMASQDCYDSFGKYIASMLKSMPAHKALALQPKIVSLITSGCQDNSDSAGVASSSQISNPLFIIEDIE